MKAITFTLLLLAVFAFLLAFSFVLRGAFMRTAPQALTLIITKRIDHSCNWFTLILQRPLLLRFLPLPRYASGQSVAIALPDAPLKRRYSLARWNALSCRYELTIKPEPKGKFTQRLAQFAHSGTRLKVYKPSGDFVLQKAHTRRSVFIAGGVGITPLLAMIEQAVQDTSAFPELVLLWQIRFDQEAIYRDCLTQLAQNHPHLQVHILISQSILEPARRLKLSEVKQTLGGFSDSNFYLCAGTAMLDDLTAELGQHGVEAERIHFERFSIAHSGENATENTGPLSLQIDDQTVIFDGHRSLLDAIEEAGISTQSDCRTGSCGLCRLRLVEGETQALLTPEFTPPSGQILSCCTRAKSKLRLQTVLV